MTNMIKCVQKYFVILAVLVATFPGRADLITLTDNFLKSESDQVFSRPIPTHSGVTFRNESEQGSRQ